MTTTASRPFPELTRPPVAVGPGNRRLLYTPVIPAPPWSLGLAGVSVYIAAAVGRVSDVFPMLAPLHLALLSAGLAIVCVALDTGALSRINASLNFATSWCVLGILLWAVLGVPTSLWPGGSVGIIRTMLLKVVVMYFVVIGAVRHPRDVTRLLAVFVGSTALYAVMVLIRFRSDPSAIRDLGLYDYDANDFATLIACTVPLAVHLVVTRFARIPRAAGLAAVGALLLAFIWANSRGGFLALLAGSLILLFGYRAVRALYRFSVAGVLALAFLAAASPSFWARMDSIADPGQDYNMTSSEGRLQLWERGIGYMMARPVFGVGAGGFPTAEGTLSSESKEAEAHGRGLKWSEPHNSFVQAGAELGLPGLLIFIAMLWTAARGLRRMEDPGLATALVASVVAFAVGGFFLSLAYKEMLYALMAFCVALRTSRPVWNA